MAPWRHWKMCLARGSRANIRRNATFSTPDSLRTGYELTSNGRLKLCLVERFDLHGPLRLGVLAKYSSPRDGVEDRVAPVHGQSLPKARDPPGPQITLYNAAKSQRSWNLYTFPAVVRAWGLGEKGLHCLCVRSSILEANKRTACEALGYGSTYARLCDSPFEKLALWNLR